MQIRKSDRGLLFAAVVVASLVIVACVVQALNRDDGRQATVRTGFHFTAARVLFLTASASEEQAGRTIFQCLDASNKPREVKCVVALVSDRKGGPYRALKFAQELARKEDPDLIPAIEACEVVQVHPVQYKGFLPCASNILKDVYEGEPLLAVAESTHGLTMTSGWDQLISEDVHSFVPQQGAARGFLCWQSEKRPLARAAAGPPRNVPMLGLTTAAASGGKQLKNILFRFADRWKDGACFNATLLLTLACLRDDVHVSLPARPWCSGEGAPLSHGGKMSDEEEEWVYGHFRPEVDRLRREGGSLGLVSADDREIVIKYGSSDRYEQFRAAVKENRQ